MIGRTMRIGLAAALLVAFSGTWAQARDQERPKRGGDRPAATQPDKERRGKARGDRGERMHKRVLQHLFKDIDLSEQQKTQLKDAFKSHHEAVKSWHEENRDKIKSLREQMFEARKAADKEKLQALREQVHELMTTRPKRIDLGVKINEILTDAQWAQFNENREAIREKRGDQRHRMRKHKEDRGEGERKHRGRPNRGDRDDDQMDL